MTRTLKLEEFSMWVDDQRVKEKELSRSPDFATRKTADFRMDSLDQAATIVGDFLHFKHRLWPGSATQP